MGRDSCDDYGVMVYLLGVTRLHYGGGRIEVLHPARVDPVKVSTLALIRRTPSQLRPGV